MHGHEHERRYYKAYGLEISSEFPLPELTVGGNGRDVRLELANIAVPADLSDTSIWRQGIQARFSGTADEPFLHWPGVTTITAKGGNLLQFGMDASAVEPERLSLYAMSEAFGMILFQRGYFLLHASAVQIGQEAVLFVGPPGVGKSTTAAALAQLGCPVLDDDLAALSIGGEGGAACIQPGLLRIKMWPDTANGLGFDSAALAPLLPDTSKLVLAAQIGQKQGALPLRHVFFLVPSHATKLVKMSLREAQVSLLRFFPCPSALLRGKHAVAHFAQSRQLLEHVCCWELRNAHDFRQLRRLAARLVFELPRNAEDRSNRTSCRLETALTSKCSVVDLIAPHSVEQFFATYFERAPLHVRRNDRLYYAHVVGIREIDELLENAALPSQHVRVIKDGNETLAPAYSANGVVDTPRLLTLLHEGSTAIIDSADTLVDGLKELCDIIERQMEVRVQANIYITPPGATGFAPHYDDHDVVIMQVFGAKRWRLYHSPETLPSVRQPYKKRDHPIGLPTREFDLGVGDSLYIPRGVIHEGSASTSGSIHVTLGLHPSYWFDLVQELGRMSQDDPRFRRSVPCAISSGQERETFRDEFMTLLAQFVSAARFDMIMSRRASTFVANRRHHNEGRLADVMHIAAMSLESVVVQRENIVFRRENNGKVTCVSFEGRVMEIPRFLSRSLDTILGSDAFAVKDLEGLIDDDGRLELVRKFVREGFLRVVQCPQA